MPNLDTILCLGQLAYRAACAHYNVAGEWPNDRDERQWREVDGVRICSMAHLGRRGINSRLKDIPVHERVGVMEEDFRLALTR
jgi:hypothetical protein